MVINMEDIKLLVDIIFNSNFKDLFIAIFIISTFIILQRLLLCKVLCFFKRLIKKTRNNFDDIIIEALEKPIAKFISYLGVYYAINYLALASKNDNILDFNNKILKTAIIIFISWIIYNFTLEKSFIYERLKCKCDTKSNKILFPFVSMTIRIVILVIAVSIIAKEFGFSGFITGLGISGVVFALAAQDTFSNLFGGIVIVFDKPFAIGDWIETENIEGVVEEITFRSTRIRTFAKALIIVPNSKLANSNIINWSKREERRIILRIPINNKVRSKKLRECINGIEQKLIENKRISNESLIVNLDEIKLGYNNLFVYCYIPCKTYYEYKKMKEEVIFIIITTLEEKDVELAANISELYMKNE